MRREFFVLLGIVIILEVALIAIWPWTALSLIIVLPVALLGLVDAFQKKQTIRRNFPVMGRFRYLLEMIRPEINQYFVESDTDGVPFNREQRSVVYQRAKNVLDTQPFGTRKDVYAPGYEWINHSLMPVHVSAEDMRVTVGGPDCKKPYSASILNVSAMSYGALGSNAIMSLNWGAKMGNFAHNSGEGGISPFHKKYGGDIIWQIGTGYFACRTEDGQFDPDMFAEKAKWDQVKMIEIKLSQGAKPGHGGILPAAKVTQEISEIRGVPMGKDVNSPPAHREFSTPEGLLHFVKKLRDLSGGKPVGFKMCLGKRREFIAICKAMVKTGICPDFIAVDGGEGGTGAAPLEFANHMGSPGREALIFVHNALVGFDVRDKMKLIYSGKVTTGFGVLKHLCLGADMIYSARAMMMAIGCIQALKCNSNECPAGIATTDPQLNAGLSPTYKAKRVQSFHKETIESSAHIMGSAGISDLSELRPWHVTRRITATETRHYGELYPYLSKGQLLGDDIPQDYLRVMRMSQPDTFAPIAEMQ